MKKLILLSILFIVGCGKQESKTIQESEIFSVISRKYPNSTSRQANKAIVEEWEKVK